MTRTSVVVAAGLLVDDDRVLVTRRREGDHLGGHWEFPGGKVREGESVEAALRRELREELGIGTEPTAIWGAVRHRYADRDVHIHFLFARIVEGTPHPHAADELRWASPSELERLPFPAADRAIVEELNRCHRSGIPLSESRQPRFGNGEDAA